MRNADARAPVLQSLGTVLSIAMLLLASCAQSPLRHPEDVRRLVAENPGPTTSRFAPLSDVERAQIMGKFEPYQYRLGIGDRLEVRGDTEGLRRKETATEGTAITVVQVKPDGMIYLPVLGGVPAKGLTVVELQNDLLERVKATELLDENELKHPFVTVDVVSYKSQKYFMLGAVGSQGTHLADGTTTLLEAFTKAGGIRPDADLDLAYVMRNSKVLPVSIADIVVRGDLSRNIVMRHHDVVHIPRKQAKRVYMLGEVASPGPVPMEDGRLTLAAAITSAGGLRRESADENVIRVFRGSLHNPRCFTLAACEVYSLGEGILLHPGDRILVAPTQLATASMQLNQVMPFITQPVSAALQPLLLYRNAEDLAK